MSRADTPSAIPLVELEVEASDGGAAGVLRKTYHTPPGLRWRTILRRSRAEREFRNLAALASREVPCIRPVRWSEQRSRGCVLECTIETGFVRGSRDLQAALRSGAAAPRRRRWAVGLGRLLRALHGAGYCSGTLSLRNVLVAEASDTLLLCDQPYASALGRGWLARAAADLDLYDAFFSTRRLEEWSTTERWRGLLAYCDGDGTLARRLWARIGRRSSRAMHWRRQWVRVPFVRALARIPLGAGPEVVR